MSARYPVLIVCTWALRLAGLLVPRNIRAQWIQDWAAEVRHGCADLEHRGYSRSETWSKLLRFSIGGFADAADLRRSHFDLRYILGHPAFCLAVPVALLCIACGSTRGFRHSRQALAGLPWHRPEELVLLSRSAGVMGIEATPAAADFIRWQERFKGGVAGFAVDGTVLRVTPSFYDVLGEVPRVRFDFLGHTIQAVKPLGPESKHIGILARVEAGGRAKHPLRQFPATSGSGMATNFPQARVREPLIFSVIVFGLALGMGIVLALIRPGSVLFFSVKACLFEGVIAATWAELMTRLPLSSAGGYSLITVLLLPGMLLVAVGVALWAALHDQRRRCPVCCHLLAMPVRVGTRSSVILDRPGIEVLCLRGHGALIMPAAGVDSAEPVSWVVFDESWKACFAEGGVK